MNLHGIVSPYVAAVNPFVSVTIYPSVGYTTSPDGTRVPAYGASVTVPGQVQSLTYNDIQQLNGLNIAGERRAIYLNGDTEGLVRALNKGGDIVVFPDGSTWLVAYVLENWNPQDGWVKIAVTLQDSPFTPGPPVPITPIVPSLVELGNQTTYTLANGSYVNQQVLLVDNLLLISPSYQININGKFNVGPTITMVQTGQGVLAVWDGITWIAPMWILG